MPFRVPHGGEKLVERVVYGEKIFRQLRYRENTLINLTLLFVSIQLNEIARIMHFIAISNLLHAKNNNVFHMYILQPLWGLESTEKGYAIYVWINFNCILSNIFSNGCQNFPERRLWRPFRKFSPPWEPRLCGSWSLSEPKSVFQAPLLALGLPTTASLISILMLLRISNVIFAHMSFIIYICS